MQTDIAQLLGVSATGAPVPDLTPTQPQTAETYLGYLRLDSSRYAGGPIAKNKAKNYPSVRRPGERDRLHRQLARSTTGTPSPGRRRR